MAKTKNIFCDFERNAVLALPAAIQKVKAMPLAKMFVVSKTLKGTISENDIPDALVSEEMAERYLEIRPPQLSLMPAYQSVINEIEQSYVTGNDFSAISASCVVIERLLNEAREVLHKHHRDKTVRRLWGKGPTNSWKPNIDALKRWDYFDDVFADELCSVYTEIRCKYLHSGKIKDLRADALRAVKTAYKLMTIFIGFPDELFALSEVAFMCRNESDPRFHEFYKPYMKEG